MSDLRPEGDRAARAELVLRNFRAVRDGPDFCWDLMFSELSEVEESIELPIWFRSWDEPALEARAGRPSLAVKQGLEDRVFLSAVALVDDDTREQWAHEIPGTLRWIKLTAREGRSELVWCVRIEGGPELATPIARAWTLRSELTVRGAQLTLAGAGMAAPPREPLRALPPEPDDDEPEAPRPRRRVARP